MKLFALGLATASAREYDEQFQAWQQKYGVVQNGADEVYATFADNYAQIEAWNDDPTETAVFSTNQFSGMTWKEFEATMLTYRGGGDAARDIPILEDGTESMIFAGDVDWDVTPAKDQGSCGSCWAFGTIGGIEAKYKQKTSSTVLLSEQQLVDCDKSCDGSGSTTCDSHCNCGCSGGQADWAYGNYLKGGVIYTSASYPYKARGGTCTTGVDSGVRISGFTEVQMSDSNLALALNSGAVVVAIGANGAFQSYSSGILSNPTTSCSLNHQVMVTGYGANYWKVKNSWGSSWGEGGFIRFGRATGGCGPFGLFTYMGVVPVISSSVEV